MTTINLFDSHMRFGLPPDSDIAALPVEAQKRFELVREADNRLLDATKQREAVEARIKANELAHAATDELVKSLLPKWTPMDEIRAMIQAGRDR